MIESLHGIQLISFWVVIFASAGIIFCMLFGDVPIVWKIKRTEPKLRELDPSTAAWHVYVRPKKEKSND